MARSEPVIPLDRDSHVLAAGDVLVSQTFGGFGDPSDIVDGAV